MIGAVYLFIAIFFGSAVCSRLFPELGGMAAKSYCGQQLKISRLFVLVPAWVYTGVIPMTWCVYILAYLLRNAEHGMRIANIVCMILFFTGGVVLYLQGATAKKIVRLEKKDLLFSKGEVLFLALVLYLSIRLFWTTFRIEDNTLYVGLSVFSDFSPHLGMIRSFSSGNNFPTSYSHFAGEDIKYHFMFQFLAGNLEYLGMRLDFAFNIPSLIGFVSTFSLLYVLGAKLTGKRAVGFLACLLFAFRSSPSVFRYLAELPSEVSIKDALFEHSEFIGYSTHEDWGLWNLNVYCNQRHFAFSLGVLLLAVLAFLPLLYRAVSRLKSEWWEGRDITIAKAGKTKEDGFVNSVRFIIGHIRFFFDHSLFYKEGWFIEGAFGLKRAVGIGLILGLLAFWNGAVTIAALLVLFVLAIVSDRRLEFFIAAVISVVLSVLQSSFFIEGSAVSASIYYGFIAENRTAFGVLDYIFRLTGFVLFLVAAVFAVSDAVKRCVILAFSMPFVFSFYISLTPDVTVNHKYIMVSLMLFCIPAALGLVLLWEKKRAAVRVAAVFLAAVLTVTGAFEYIIVLNRNETKNNLRFSIKDELTAWIRENATAQDIFLTSNYALNNVVLGGAMLFDGWQYFAWSAGYDTEQCDIIVREMYEADSPEQLRTLAEQNNIRFIIVDYDNRVSMEYEVREDIIERTFLAVYSQGEGDQRTTIYDTAMPVK